VIEFSNGACSILAGPQSAHIVREYEATQCENPDSAELGLNYAMQLLHRARRRCHMGIDRRALNLYIAVLDDKLRNRLQSTLQNAGYAPKLITPDAIQELEPTFGPNGEAVFFVYAGPEKQKMHDLAEHVYREWSLKGFVFYVVFHPSECEDEDIFRLWSSMPSGNSTLPSSSWS
jgi:hypothetical protein